MVKERIVRVNQRRLDRINADRFAVQTLAKKFQVRYEYLVNDEWVDGPPSQKPEGKRIVFEGANNPLFQGRERFRAARDTYLVWKSILDASVYEPVNKEAIIERLLWARTADLADVTAGKYGSDKLDWCFVSPPPLALFTPWGVRPEGQFGNPEIAVMDRLKSLQEEMKKRSISTFVFIMPADLYATEINRQVEPAKAAEYFETVKEAAEARGFFVKPWSQERSGLYYGPKEYATRAAELTPEEITRLLGKASVREALEAAKRRSGYQGNQDVVNAAFAYLRERICEAEHIEYGLKPVKVSAVAKNKDNFVDRDLPRIYILPTELQFPWLK